MISRVTHGVVVRELLGSVRRLEVRLTEAQAALTTGKRIREPSDDPSALARAGRVREEIADLDALARTISFAS